MPRTKEIDELLTRGVAGFVDPEGVFEKKLFENPKSIVIKFGVDPTRPDIHLGHAVVFRKLRKFQDLGCKVIFLIGDFTTLIGDPTGKSKVRPEISQQEIEENMKTYLDQVGKILKTEPEVFSWIKNSDWYINISDLVADSPVIYTDNESKQSVTFSSNSFFAKTALYDATRMQKTHVRNTEIFDVTVRTFLATLRNITHSRLIARDMFEERIKKGEELFMHEMMYPVLQGIDSSVLASIYGSCDLEVGGSDQTFNMLMGRDVMRSGGKMPQAVLSFELLEGTDGKEKMSKSLDNYVSIIDEPNDMFGKIMSVPDTLIAKYFELCTYTPLQDIEEIKNYLKDKNKNPRDIKIRLAREITEIYHGRGKASAAEEHFVKTFSEGAIPTEIPEILVKKNTLLSDALAEGEIISSKSEYKRLIDGKAVEWMEKNMVINSHGFILEEAGTFRIGKKRFVKILFK